MPPNNLQVVQRLQLSILVHSSDPTSARQTESESDGKHYQQERIKICAEDAKPDAPEDRTQRKDNDGCQPLDSVTSTDVPGCFAPTNGHAPGFVSPTNGHAPGFVSPTNGHAPGFISPTNGHAPGLFSPTNGHAPGLFSPTNGPAPGFVSPTNGHAPD